MVDAIALLEPLGFSEYEGRAYVALCERSPLNGYELAKVSGLPRANVYGVLQKLEERGAVVRIETPAGVQYAPVPPADLARQLERRFAGALQAAEEALAALAAPPPPSPVWNVAGAGPLLDRARGLLAGTQREALIACGPLEAAALAADVDAAEARGVQVTTLCLAGCPQECGHCRGAIHRVPLAPDERWLVLVADDHELFAGEAPDAGTAQGVGTQQRLLVALARWAIVHNLPGAPQTALRATESQEESNGN
jgi:HTH-type transcriptional regulator, sugar sensing transcriptional regulator